MTTSDTLSLTFHGVLLAALEKGQKDLQLTLIDKQSGKMEFCIRLQRQTDVIGKYDVRGNIVRPVSR